jgi:hypothetical protein
MKKGLELVLYILHPLAGARDILGRAPSASSDGSSMWTTEGLPRSPFQRQAAADPSTV